MKIKWTPIAKRHLMDTKKYLKVVWGNEVTKNFIKKVEQTINTIITGVVVHQNYEDLENVRQVLVTKHNYLIYMIDGDNLIIVGLINNYKDPHKNYEEIKTSKKNK